ncbi:hypothetical protein QO010_000643 [Caulobacter ginsengisoli]|uniref:DOMON-like domain-containing protein n=1 Tax=Caulobacter ginsengisoli TaxID=400775 RepID=A0ABU0ILK0_9CAUL|nr:DOMON-like domain-containing protein [Caulobacter ginsengisoli]MDQ0462895.1 hypothetical protein [Caulobacter ginsengisoli]
MLLALKAHPDNPSPPSGIGSVEYIEVDVLRGTPQTLTLTWLLTGDLGGIVLPAFRGRSRQDDLWKHSCFELFVRGEGESYYEFNFSPSGGWAAYRLASYRGEMTNAPGTPVLDHGFRTGSKSLSMVATLDLSGLPGLSLAEPLRIGLSAIIEDPGGQRSFWALAHPPGEPDFHNPVAFAGDIPTMDYA